MRRMRNWSTIFEFYCPRCTVSVQTRATKLRRLPFMHRTILNSNIVDTQRFATSLAVAFIFLFYRFCESDMGMCGIVHTLVEKHFCCTLQMRFRCVCSKREPSYRLLLFGFVGQRNCAPAFNLAYDRQHNI